MGTPEIAAYVDRKKETSSFVRNMPMHGFNFLTHFGWGPASRAGGGEHGGELNGRSESKGDGLL